MNHYELAKLIADHGEMYEPDWYHGCDCGHKCSADEWSEHLATVVLTAMGRGAGLTDAEREALRDCVTDLPPDDGPPHLFAAVESIKGDAYSAGLAAAYLTAPSCEAMGTCRALATQRDTEQAERLARLLRGER